MWAKFFDSSKSDIVAGGHFEKYVFNNLAHSAMWFMSYGVVWAQNSLLMSTAWFDKNLIFISNLVSAAILKITIEIVPRLSSSLAITIKNLSIIYPQIPSPRPEVALGMAAHQAVILTGFWYTIGACFKLSLHCFRECTAGLTPPSTTAAQNPAFLTISLVKTWPHNFTNDINYNLYHFILQFSSPFGLPYFA